MTMRRQPSHPMPFGQARDLLARSDAMATVGRLVEGVDPAWPHAELHIELVALAVLRARDAAERAGR